MAIAWKKNLYIHGRRIKGEQFKSLIRCCAIPQQGHLTGKRWDPEYMALTPEIFLDGVDEGDFGKQSALSLWLELDEKGWMKAGFGESNRELFEDEYEKLKAFSV